MFIYRLVGRRIKSFSKIRTFYYRHPMINWGVLTSIILAIFFCAGCATNQANDGSDRIKKKSIGIKDTETHKNELFHNESVDGNFQEKKVSPLSSDSNRSLSADSKREIKSKVSNEINKKSNNDKKKYSDQGSGSKKQKHFKIKEESTLTDHLDKSAGKQKIDPRQYRSSAETALGNRGNRSYRLQADADAHF